MKKLLTLVIVLTLFLTACSNEEIKSDKSIYTTLYPLTYITEEIVKDTYNVTSILPNSSDMHHFEPTMKDLMNIQDSDLFIALGGTIEPYVSENENITNLDNTMIIDDYHLFETETTNSDHDHEDGVHVWLSPDHMLDIAELIFNKIVEISPEYRSFYEKNYGELRNKLTTLHINLTDVGKDATKEFFVVTHAAYGVWEDYGIEQLAILDASGTEGSLDKNKIIIDAINSNDIKYICFEQNISSKTGDAILDATKTTKIELHNLATLTDDDIENHEDYFTIMTKNIEILKKVLEVKENND